MSPEVAELKQQIQVLTRKVLDKDQALMEQRQELEQQQHWVQLLLMERVKLLAELKLDRQALALGESFLKDFPEYPVAALCLARIRQVKDAHTLDEFMDVIGRLVAACRIGAQELAAQRDRWPTLDGVQELLATAHGSYRKLMLVDYKQE